MSKRRAREKVSAQNAKPSTPKCQASAETLAKVNEIRSSAWRHTVDKGDDSASDDGEEEETRHGETIYVAGTSFVNIP